MFLTKTTALLLMLLIHFTLYGQDKNILDLTKEKEGHKSTSTEIGGGSVVSSGSKVRQNLPLRFTLTAIDKSTYQLGDAFIYEVSLENISKEIVSIPWGSYKCSSKTGGSQNLRAVISIVVNDEAFGDQFLGSQGIHGCDILPSSIKKIRPNQKVKIRLSGVWWLTDSRVYQKIIKSLPQTFSIRATISIFGGDGNTKYEPVISNNSVAVELKKRQ